eukprot:3912965-Amphidinium_carterae.1
MGLMESSHRKRSKQEHHKPDGPPLFKSRGTHGADADARIVDQHCESCMDAALEYLTSVAIYVEAPVHREGTIPWNHERLICAP